MIFKRGKTFFILFILFLIFSSWTVCFAETTGIEGIGTALGDTFGSAPTQDELQIMIKQPQTRFAIPGLKFSSNDLNKLIYKGSDGNTYISIPYLGEYIKSLYKYAVAAAGLVSVIVILYSGIQWMSPGNISIVKKGDNKEQINNSKKRIVGASIGLFIAIFSYAILYNINPNLTNLKNIDVLYVKNKELPDGVYEIDDQTYEEITGQKKDNSPAGKQKNIDHVMSVAQSGANGVNVNGPPDEDDGVPETESPATSSTPVPVPKGVPAATDFIMSQFKDAAAGASFPPCLIYPIIVKESGGNFGVIGHDEEKAGMGGKQSYLYNITNGAKGKILSSGEPNDDGAPGNHKSIVNSAPDYGLDWRFSHGIGIGQVTLWGTDYYRCSDNQRGINLSMGGKNHCFTIPELLTPEGGALATIMMANTKINKAIPICKKRLDKGCKLDFNNDDFILTIYKKYGGAMKKYDPSAWKKPDEIARATAALGRITTRLNLYKQCKQEHPEWANPPGGKNNLSGAFSSISSSANNSTGINGIVGTALGDTFGSPPTQDELQILIKQPQTKFTIPGLKFSSADINKLKVEEDGNTFILIPFLGEYIAAIYKYLVAGLGVVCVIMIIFAGIQWTTSRGNTEAISSAQKRLIGSLTGLIITVGSFTLLYTINPELVNFKSLRVLYIKKEALKEGSQEYDDDRINPAQYTSAIAQYKTYPSGVVPCDNPQAHGFVKIPYIPGIKYVGRPNQDYLLPEVIEGLKKVGTEATSQGYVIAISTACRNMARQNDLANKNPAGVKKGTTAKPGRSPHGFGYAVDVHLLKDGKDLTAKIVGEATSGGQCSITEENPEILNAIKKQSEIFFKAGWVRLTTESWHYEYGTAGKYCRGQCYGYASLCNKNGPDDCPKAVNGCKQ